MPGEVEQRRCKGLTLKGQPCRALAGGESDFCGAHRGQALQVVQPVRVVYERPAQALETLDDVIRDMLEWQSRFTQLIEAKQASEGLAVSELAKLLAIHGQNASRIGQLLRDQRALSKEAVDELLGALAVALDEVSTIWGRRL
jgi:hypothetical protein